MDYLDVLRQDGWIADPTDKVRVIAIHEASCPAARGRSCWCRPRLELAVDMANGRDGDLDRDPLPLDVASGE
jgi:hypothetical protein